VRLLAWVLQVLILTSVIHLFLRFVRTTRGSRLIRGLFVSVFVGVVGLWGLSKSLQLEELEHIVQGSVGFVLVVFAIVFQPELRRGIAQLGEHSLLGRLMPRAGKDTVQRVVTAACNMSDRRHGALIAFERESSLNTFVEEATTLDAKVTARLIETLFHPGTALHDGAIVVRKDRIVAAGCFFPLPQEGEIDRSFGTRHRAALGVTEETDAVVLVVSEETGAISIAKAGGLRTALGGAKLEEELRKDLEDAGAGKAEERRGVSLMRSARGAWRRDAAWLASSLLIACVVLYVAHQDIEITRSFSVNVHGVAADQHRQPQEGEVLLVLPGSDQRVVEPQPDQRLRVEVSGSRADVDGLGGSISGVMEVTDPAWDGGPLLSSSVRWSAPGLGLDYAWADGTPPSVTIERYASRQLALGPAQVRVDASKLDPRYEFRPEDVVILDDDHEVRVQGPATLLPRLGVEIPFVLEPIVLSAEERLDRTARIGLDRSLKELGFSLADEPTVRIKIPIRPARRDVGVIQREIALVSLAPDRSEELLRWAIPVHQRTARFTIQTSGLVPIDADPGSPALLERFSTIRRFVEDNLLVFVDVAELPPGGEGRSVPVRTSWRRDWRKSLDVLGLERGMLGGKEELDVRLESEPEILLERRGPPVSEDGAPGASDGEGSGGVGGGR